MNCSYQLILATDLDGTFLEGHSQLKNFFYSDLLSLKDKICLIYVTGRSINSVKELCLEGYLPEPHFIIGDHGRNIADGKTFKPINKLQKSIDVYLPCVMDSEVLLKGSNKGTSLLKLIKYMKLERDVVVTCGDSLNDFSLFQTGLKSIIVRNAEEALINEAKELSNIYYSPFPGLLGVLDGLNFYCMHHLFNCNSGSGHIFPWGVKFEMGAYLELSKNRIDKI
jgi:hydroxymethylpyrimidine pyrophosphatase-like HAD family hydrolase